MIFDHGMLPGSLELAYLGDAVFELRVREKLLARGGHARDMHKRAVKFVCARAQAEALKMLTLNETESAVVRRARNAHQTPTKNAEIADYHMATAFEALLGYLYAVGETARLDEILEIALKDMEG